MLCAAARAAAGSGTLHVGHGYALVRAGAQLPVLSLHLVWRAATAGESHFIVFDLDI